MPSKKLSASAIALAAALASGSALAEGLSVSLHATTIAKCLEITSSASSNIHRYIFVSKSLLCLARSMHMWASLPLDHEYLVEKSCAHFDFRCVINSMHCAHLA